jgi:SecD/SecF fusion protein
MRNKGFFWFLTILLTVICIYQLSFTWVSNGVESKVEQACTTKVDDMIAALKESGDSLIFLPNDTKHNIYLSETREIAIAAFINDSLKQLAEKPVYPLFGSTFKDVKKRSLAFGLDLVGGMSVTLEISVPDLVKSYLRNPNSPSVKKLIERARGASGTSGEDFIDVFAREYQKQYNDDKMVKLFNIAENDELNSKSSNEDVLKFLRDRAAGSMDGVEEIMERRINQFGVAQPNIQRDPANNRLYIELPGVQDEVTVAERLKSTANLQFFEMFTMDMIKPFLDQADAISKTSYVEPEEVEEELAEAEADTLVLEEGAEVDSNDLADTDTVEEAVSLDDMAALDGGAQGGGGLLTYLKPFTTFSAGFCSPEHKSKVNEILNRRDVKALFPPNLAFMWSEDLESISEDGKEMGYVLYPTRIPEDGKARVGGKDIKSAQRGFDTESGKITVDLTMTAEGADKWGSMTEENKGRCVAITMDSVVYSAPMVNEPILNGNTQISGNFSLEEANDLAGLLNGGALPAPCVIKEQNRVGPTIGAENSRAGLISFGFALLLVFAYMIFYYGKGGLVADVALLANILFIFGSLASFGAVLTLAGIAGIVLTIGMAVDANVLIFERIREEEAAGKDKQAAIDEGFKKALSSIIDANVTTMLTAIVLKVFGTGPIESFATTLIIGIFTSVFAALVISRLVINWMLAKGKSISFDTKTTRGAFKNMNINFVGRRKTFYLISGILVAGGMAAIFVRGLKPSVEFSGGRTYSVKFEKAVDKDIEYLREKLQATFGAGSSLELKTKSSNHQLEITTNYKLNDEDANEEVKQKMVDGLKTAEEKVGSADILGSRSVSATVSKELVSSSTIAIVVSLIIIFAYILMRFGRWQYSTGAIIAMIHDVALVLASFAVFHGILPFNMDVDQAFIAAILTVIGYSINDTVIVFDRIRENLGLGRHKDENDQINDALNSTLSRTVNTSMTTFIVLLIIFLFGGAAIKGFIFALMVGIVVGTYSSLCIATPILIDFSRSKIAEDNKKRAADLAAAAAAEAAAKK